MAQHRGDAHRGNHRGLWSRGNEAQTRGGMKGKQFALILILFAIFGGAALFFYQRNAESWKKSATTVDKKIVKFSLNDVAHITIKSSTAELNLAKVDEVWRVKERADYPADFEMISRLIRKIWELSAVQDVQVGSSQLGRLQLLPPDHGANGGTLLDLKDAKEKRLAALLVGKKYLREGARMSEEKISAGRYVKAEDNSGRVALISDALDEVDPQPPRWLNHDFVKIDNPKSIAIAGPTPDMNWKVGRKSASDPWEFSDSKEKVDTTKISSAVNLLSGAAFADVLAPNTPPAETGLDHPATATIETFDNFVYVFRLGKLMGENYPLLVTVNSHLPKERVPGKDEKPEDKAKLDQEFQAKQKQLTDKLAREKKFENWPYLIAKATIDQFPQDRKAVLLQEPPPAPAATSPPTATSTSAPKAVSTSTPKSSPTPKPKKTRRPKPR
jgi:hypothetical protein